MGSLLFILAYTQCVCYCNFSSYTQCDIVGDDMDYTDSKDILIELRTSTGMTRREFCEYFDIPYRTLQDWELGNRKMPDYLLRLMAYKVEMEKMFKKE